VGDGKRENGGRQGNKKKQQKIYAKEENDRILET
jgi:hypothetical protein